MVLIFGGSFDPIHQGHLDLARRAIDRYRPSKLYLIPNKKNPLKDFAPGASPSDRFEMARLAVAELGRSEIETVDWEIRREGPSYMWDTVQVVKHLHKAPSIVLILGDEVLGTFSGWHRAQDLLQTVDIVVCSRHQKHSNAPLERAMVQCGIRDGFWENSPHPTEKRFVHTHGRRWIETFSFEALPISGTEIREILATYRGTVRPPGLAEAVWDFIKKYKVYSVK